MSDNPRTLSEQEVHTNPLLALPAETGESELKNFLVEYTGTKLEEEEVSVNMIAEVLAAEFPEFVFAFAEENFLRGYQLGLNDAENLLRDETEATKQPSS